jgi:hypothetical protein
MAKVTHCPVCGLALDDIQRFDGRDAYHLVCQRCGRYGMSGSLLAVGLPPRRSRSLFQLLPYGGFESMKSNSRAGNASFASVECSGPPMMLSAASPSPLRSRSALQMAYVSALISWP